MNYKLLFASLVATATLMSCASYKRHVTQSYYEVSPSHHTIAVLPYEIFHYGRLPKKNVGIRPSENRNLREYGFSEILNQVAHS